MPHLTTSAVFIQVAVLIGNYFLLLCGRSSHNHSRCVDPARGQTLGLHGLCRRSRGQHLRTSLRRTHSSGNPRARPKSSRAAAPRGWLQATGPLAQGGPTLAFTSSAGSPHFTDGPRLCEAERRVHGFALPHAWPHPPTRSRIPVPTWRGTADSSRRARDARSPSTRRGRAASPEAGPRCPRRNKGSAPVGCVRLRPDPAPHLGTCAGGALRPEGPARAA